jgi:Zn-dependent peptidase ImmA (M78 family)
MIPKQIKVGAMWYQVNIVPDMHARQGLYGEVFYNNQTIEIAGDVSEQRQLNVFLHELIHAILFESGDMTEQDEAYVRRFSNLLTQVFIDNEWSLMKGGDTDANENSNSKDEG